MGWNMSEEVEVGQERLVWYQTATKITYSLSCEYVENFDVIV